MSGKSCYIRYQITQKFSHIPFYIFNGSPDLASLPNVQEIENLEEASHLSHCGLIAEDLIMVKNGDLRFLKICTNILFHHQCLRPIFLVSHSLIGNNLIQMLSFVHCIIFTGAKNNLPSLEASLRVLGYPKQAKESIKKKFLNENDKYTYHVLNIQEGSFTPLRIGSVSVAAAEPTLSPPPIMPRRPRTRDKPDTIGTLLRTGQKLLQDHDKGMRANLILELVLRVLPLQSLDTQSLTLAFKAGSRKQRFQLNLVDYCVSLLDREKPPKSIRLLHRFVTQSLCFPSHFIENPHLHP